MKNISRLFLIFLLTPLLWNCQNEQAADTSYAPEAIESQAMQAEKHTAPSAKHEEAENSSTPQTSTVADENPTQNKKIIYTADVRMQVDSLEASIQDISNLITGAGGYISHQYMNDNRYQKEVNLTIRLPVDQFKSGLERITALASFVNHKNLESRDVSMEWVDLESRLTTKRAVRDRYIEILQKKATKVQDILDAEDKIRVITEEIEAKEGQLRYLRDQVGMSTLRLAIYQTQQYRNEPSTYKKSFGEELKTALSRGFLLIRTLLVGLLSIWPLLLLLPLGLWWWRRRRKG